MLKKIAIQWIRQHCKIAYASFSVQSTQSTSVVPLDLWPNVWSNPWCDCFGRGFCDWLWRRSCENLSSKELFHSILFDSISMLDSLDPVSSRFWHFPHRSSLSHEGPPSFTASSNSVLEQLQKRSLQVISWKRLKLLFVFCKAHMWTQQDGVWLFRYFVERRVAAVQNISTAGVPLPTFPHVFSATRMDCAMGTGEVQTCLSSHPVFFPFFLSFIITSYCFLHANWFLLTQPCLLQDSLWNDLAVYLQPQASCKDQNRK